MYFNILSIILSIQLMTGLWWESKGIKSSGLFFQVIFEWREFQKLNVSFLELSQKCCIFVTFSSWVTQTIWFKLSKINFSLASDLIVIIFSSKGAMGGHLFFTTWERKEIRASNRVWVVGLIREQGQWQHRDWKWCTHVSRVT